MATEYKKAPKFVTPSGKAKYAWLNKPDVKFDKDNKGGHYKITLILDGPSGEKVAAQLQAEYDKAVAEGQKAYAEKKANPDKTKRPKQPFKAATAPWSVDEETGEYSIGFKLPAKLTKKDGEVVDLHVAVFNKAGTPLDKALRVGTGSTVQVSYEVRPFDMQPVVGAGLSLRLLAVRVIDLVEYSGGSAESYGFENSADEEEDEPTPEVLAAGLDAAEEDEF